MQHPTKQVTLTELLINAAISGCLTAIAIGLRMKAIQQAARTRLATPHFLSKLGSQP